LRHGADSAVPYSGVCDIASMKILGVEVKPGNIIEHKNDLWKCLKSQAVKPGKGGAYNQVELKSITKGTKLNERFRSSETIEKATLDEKKFQFLYSSNDEFFFMDSENFEQISINKTLVEDSEKFLKENLEVTIESYQDKPLSVILPRSVEYEVLETDSVVKGQTASGSYKPATIQNGVKILVPPFVSQGDKILVDTITQEYLKKIN
jgi:elongation factor P